MSVQDIRKSITRRMSGTRMSIDEVSAYLMNNYTTPQISEALAELLFEQEEVKPITISQEEFNIHFRIKGITADNKIERRGRPKKVDNNGPELI